MQAFARPGKKPPIARAAILAGRQMRSLSVDDDAATPPANSVVAKSRGETSRSGSLQGLDVCKAVPAATPGAARANAGQLGATRVASAL